MLTPILGHLISNTLAFEAQSEGIKRDWNQMSSAEKGYWQGERKGKPQSVCVDRSQTVGSFNIHKSSVSKESAWRVGGGGSGARGRGDRSNSE